MAGAKRKRTTQSYTGYRRGRDTAGAFARGRSRSSRRMRRRNLRTAGFLGIEKKFYDLVRASYSITAPTDATGGEADPAASGALSTPQQGDGEQNRDGKRIIAKSLILKGTITRPAMADQTAAPAGQKVFLALVLDTQTNAAQMNSEDCFKNGGIGATGNVALTKNLLFANRFKILKSQVFDMTAPLASYDGTNIEVGGRVVSFDWFVKLNNLPINFNSGTTAVVTNVIDNSIHLIAFATSTSPQCTLDYQSRMRFIG